MLLLVFICLFNTSFIAYAKSQQVISLPNVAQFTQDEKGLMWFPSQSGVHRYDGQNTLNIIDYIKQKPFFVSNYLIASRSLIFIATENQGVWRYDQETSDYQQLVAYEDIQTSITQFAVFNDNLIFTDASRGLIYIYNMKDDELIALPLSHNYHSVFQSKNKLYLVSSSQIANFDVESGKTNILFSGQYKLADANDNSFFVIRQQAGHEQVCKVTQNLVCRDISYSIQQLHLSHYNKHLWLSSKKGHLELWDAKLFSFIKETDIHFPNQYITSLYEDSFGDIWSASNEGIYQYKLLNYQNIGIPYSEQIRFNHINLLADKNRLLVGTSGAGAYDLHVSPILVKEKVGLNKALFSAKQKSIIQVLKYKNKFYILTMDGLYQWQEASERLIRLDDASHIGQYVSAKIIKDKLFVATKSKGLIIFDVEKQVRLPSINRATSKFLPSNKVSDISRDGLGQYWIATAKGIVKQSSLQGDAELIELPTVGKYVALLANQGKVYIGSQGNGIYISDLNGELIGHILPNSFIVAFFQDENTLWVSTTRGLYQANMLNDSVSMVQGTESWELSSAVQKIAQNLYVPTFQGIKVVPLFAREPSNAYVVVSEVINSKGRYLNPSSITLKSSNELISLNLAVLDYRHPEKHQFRYRINNGAWRHFSGNSLSLVGLSSGEHFIDIQGTDSLGFWSNNNAYFKVDIKQAWYWNSLSRFIYLGCFILFLGAVIWLIRVRAESLIVAKNVLQAELLLKQKTDTLVNYNLTRIKKLCLEREPHCYDEIERLSGSALQQLALKSQKVSPDSLGDRSLESAIPILVNHLRSQYHCKINAQINLSGAGELPYELQADLYRALYELAHLSIFDAQSSEIEISLRFYNQKIWLICNDNGENLTLLQKKIAVAVGIQLLNQIAEKYDSRIEFGRRRDKGNAITLAVFIANN